MAASSELSASENREVEIAELLGEFKGSIKPVRASLLYRLSLLVVACWVCLITVAYLGLVGGFGYGLYYYGAKTVQFFLELKAAATSAQPEDFPHIVTSFFRLVLYVIALIVGGLLFFYMLRALYGRKRYILEPHQVFEEREPVFFAFVEKICDVLGAPRPKKIYLVCEPMAGAALMPGVANFIAGNNCLLLGLPYVAGLNQRQLAGVIAHEFGHFSQGFGMRLGRLVRTNTAWFARIASGASRMDQTFLAWSKCDNGYLNILGYSAMLLAWLGKGVAFLFMLLSNLLGSVLARQMEFDADRYEMGLAGSDEFLPTMKRIIQLGFSYDRTLSELNLSWNERRLADDLTAMILANCDRLLDEEKEDLRERLTSTRHGFFSSHPADGLRIDAARSARMEGVFEREEPGTELFADFKLLAKRLTLKLYRAELGDEFTQSHMIATDRMVSQYKSLDDDTKALERLTQGVVTRLNPMKIYERTIREPNDPREAAKRLLESYRRVETSGDEARKAHASMEIAMGAGREVRKIRELYHGSIVGDDVLRKHEQVEANATAALARARDRLQAFEADARDHLILALELLHSPLLQKRVTNGAELCHEANRLLPALCTVCEYLPEMLDLAENDWILHYLLEYLSKNQNDSGWLVARVKKRFGMSYQVMMRLHEGLREVPYPLDHGAGDVSIAQYTLGRIEQEGGFSALLQKNRQVLENLFILYFRVMARVAAIAETFETSLGIKPLPDPPQRERPAEEI